MLAEENSSGISVFLVFFVFLVFSMVLGYLTQKVRALPTAERSLFTICWRKSVSDPRFTFFSRLMGQ